MDDELTDIFIHMLDSTLIPDSRDEAREILLQHMSDDEIKLFEEKALEIFERITNGHR